MYVCVCVKEKKMKNMGEEEEERHTMSRTASRMHEESQSHPSVHSYCMI